MYTINTGMLLPLVRLLQDIALVLQLCNSTLLMLGLDKIMWVIPHHTASCSVNSRDMTKSLSTSLQLMPLHPCCSLAAHAQMLRLPRHSEVIKYMRKERYIHASTAICSYRPRSHSCPPCTSAARTRTLLPPTSLLDRGSGFKGYGVKFSV